MRAVLDAKKLSIIYQTSVQFHSYNVPTYLSIYTCIRDSGFLTLISPLLSDSDMDPQDFEKINGLLDRETELREVNIRPFLREGHISLSFCIRKSKNKCLSWTKRLAQWLGC